MKMLRQIGSLAFVLGLFTAIFAGTPWYVMVEDDPVVPWWLRIAVFGLLGGIPRGSRDRGYRTKEKQESSRETTAA